MNIDDMLSEFLNPPNAYLGITFERVLLSLIVTFTLTSFIFFMYRKTFKWVIYTQSINMGRILTGLVVTLVVIPISLDIRLSLGMVVA